MTFYLLSSRPEPRSDLEGSLRELVTVRPFDDGLQVTTHCMYPSNGLVRVMVRGGRDTLVASDEGEALGEALAAGIEVRNPDKMLRGMVREQGLLISGGVIHTPKMPTEAASLAVLHVANTAKEVAHWLYDHNRVKRSRDFRQVLSDLLSATFREHVTHNTTVVGASNKSHRFANIIYFSNGRRLIVDSVANEASSINSRIVANMDVKATNDPTIEQRIVFDEDDGWSAADLNLLQVGAVAVPFSRSSEVIARIAKETNAA